MKKEHLLRLIIKIDSTKKIGLGSSSMSEVKAIGRLIERSDQSVDNADKIIDRLKSVDKLRLALEDSDWRNLKRDIEKILH